jgi:TP901 family phage tail tape measure protein
VTKVTNEIEIVVTSRGAPEVVAAYTAIRTAQTELTAATSGAAGADFGPLAVDAAELDAAGRAMRELAGSVQVVAAAADGAATAGLRDDLSALGPAGRTGAAGVVEVSRVAGAAGERVVGLDGRVRDARGRFIALGDGARTAARGVEAAGDASETAGRKVAGLAERADRAADRLEQIGGTLSTRVTLPLVAAGGAAVHMATDFDSSMTRIETLVGVSRDQVDAWRAAVVEMAPELGALPAELARGLFTVTSGGERGAEALDVLSDAAKASALGLGEVNTIAGTTTAAMQAYAASNLSARRATEIMVATAREGNFEVSQLAGSLGQVLPVAASMGVSFEEVGSFIASFSRVNRDASASVTGLRSYLQTLLNPSDDAEKVLRKVGLSAAALREEVREKGLSQSLLELTARFKGNEDALARVIPNVEGLVGVLGTAGLQGEEFAKVAASIQGSAGILDAAFKRLQETDGYQFKQAASEAAVLAVELGAELAPALVDVLEASRPVVEIARGAVGVFTELPGPVQTTVLVLGGIVTVAGPAAAGLASVAHATVAVRSAAVATSTAVFGVATAARGLLLIVGIGAPLVVGLTAVASAFAHAGDSAEDAARRAQGAAADFRVALRDMSLGGVQQAQLDAELEIEELEGRRAKLAADAARVVARVGSTGTADIFGSVAQAQSASVARIRSEIEGVDALLDAARDKYADAVRRNAELQGLYGSVVTGPPAPGPPRLPPFDFGDDEPRGRKKTPLQVVGPDQGFARIGTADGVRALAELRERASATLASVTVEVATAEAALTRLPRGGDAFKELNEQVYRLRGNLAEVVVQLGTIHGGLSGLRRTDLTPFLAPAGLDAARGVDVSTRGLGAARVEALDRRAAQRQYEAAAGLRIDPAKLGAADLDALQGIIRGAGRSAEEYAVAIGKGSDEFDRAGVLVVQAFGNMVQAAISGSASMEAAVVQGLASIAQAAATQINPILGAGVGVLGGLIGSLFGQRERNREPQRVVVADYESAALAKTARKEGPDVVKIQIISESGETIEEIQYALGRRARQDAQVRIPNVGGYRRVK